MRQFVKNPGSEGWAKIPTYYTEPQCQQVGQNFTATSAQAKHKLETTGLALVPQTPGETGHWISWNRLERLDGQTWTVVAGQDILASPAA